MKIERCVLCGPKSADEDVAHLNFSKTKLDEWIAFCAQADPTKVVFPSSKLCCLHFTEDSFSSINLRHNLKKNAIPSLILNNLKTSARKCNHRIEESTMNRNYGLHKNPTHCLLCKGKKIGVSSFEFPKDENIRKKWIEFCEVDSSRINIHSKLCQYHFTENDFHVRNSGRVCLNRGTIPSIRKVDIANYSRKKKKELLFMHAEDVDHVIPPKRPKLSSPSRCDESLSSNVITSLHASNMSYDFNDAGTSSREKLQLTECTLCKMMSSDIIQFRFSNNPAMRLVLTLKFGISLIQLDQIHMVCLSHFDTDDIDVDNDGKRMIKERAFPWRYFLRMIEKNSNNISPLPKAISTETVNTTAELSELGLVLGVTGL